MQNEERPIVDIVTLQRDLYIVLGLLLADKTVDELGYSFEWTQYFYENEINRLLLWIAAATRSLLDHIPQDDTVLEKQCCGEYCENIAIEKTEDLTLRQACNSIIHAEEIVPYKISAKESGGEKKVYHDRITIRGSHRNQITRAHLDIIQFAQCINKLTAFPN